MALRRARGIVWLAVAALAVAGFSGCGGDEPATTIADGAYAYTLTPAEKAEFLASLSPEDVPQVGDVDKIATSFEFNAPTWVQSWLLDGRRWLVDGHNQGSNGSYTVQGDHVTMVEPEFNTELTYEWTLEGDVLSLHLTSSSLEPEEVPGARMATEHDYVRQDNG